MSNSKQPKLVVKIYSYPKLLFLWPIIALGYAVWFFTAPAAEHSNMLEVIGWLYVFAMLASILTVSIDLERNYSFMWLVIGLAVFFLLMWLGKDVPVFGRIYDFFNGINVQYDRGLRLGIKHTFDLALYRYDCLVTPTA